MTNELKCPKCGGTRIVIEDCYNTIHDENNIIKDCYCGCCEDCGADVQWDAVYQFIGYDAIEEG